MENGIATQYPADASVKDFFKLFILTESQPIFEMSSKCSNFSGLQPDGG